MISTVVATIALLLVTLVKLIFAWFKYLPSFLSITQCPNKKAGCCHLPGYKFMRNGLIIAFVVITLLGAWARTC